MAEFVAVNPLEIGSSLLVPAPSAKDVARNREVTRSLWRISVAMTTLAVTVQSLPVVARLPHPLARTAGALGAATAIAVASAALMFDLATLPRSLRELDPHDLQAVNVARDALDAMEKPVQTVVKAILEHLAPKSIEWAELSFAMSEYVDAYNQRNKASSPLELVNAMQNEAQALAEVYQQVIKIVNKPNDSTDPSEGGKRERPHDVPDPSEWEQSPPVVTPPPPLKPPDTQYA